MKYDLAERIQARLDALGKNPSSVALEAGLGRSSVRDILLGRAANPRLDTLKKLTGPLRCTLDYLTGASSDPDRESVHSHLWWMDTEGVGMIEMAEAGVFRRPLPLVAYDPSQADVPASSVHVKYRDPRLIDWQYSLIEVGDNTLEDIHVLRGDVATVATPAFGLHIPIDDGLIVVTRRRMPSMDVEEVSIRQIQIRGEEVSFVSKCKNPPKPIVLLWFDTGSDVDSKLIPNRYAVDGGAIEVEGVVVRVTRQMPLSDTLTEFSYILD